MRNAILAFSLVLIFLTIGGLIYLDLNALTIPERGISIAGDMLESDQLLMQIILDDSRQMASWSLAVLGGVALVVLRRAENGVDIGMWSAAGLVLVGCLAVVSIYSSELIASQLVAMLAVQTLDFSVPWLRRGAQLQTYSLIAAVVIAALLAVPTLFERRK